MIRIAICDDEDVVRGYLAKALDEAEGIKVVASVSSGEAALAVYSPIDLWLMDIRMPGIGGLEAARRLRARTDPPKVLLLTSMSTVTLADAVAAGVSGFLYKDLPVASLVASINAAMAGVLVSSPETIQSFPETVRTPVPVGITADETDLGILRLVQQGYGYVDIATTVGVSESTVKKRVGAMSRRAGVRSRPKLMALASRWSI